MWDISTRCHRLIDYEVDLQGINCDFDDRSHVLPEKLNRRRRKKRRQTSPGEEEEIEEIAREDPEDEPEETVDEDDADDLEVDIVDGDSRWSGVRRLSSH